jgi:hypothetical protein
LLISPFQAYPKFNTYLNMIINTFAKGSARPNSGLVALVAIALSAMPWQAQAATISIEASDAVMIRSRVDNNAADTNQEGNALFIGSAAAGNELIRGLLKFDLSAIPVQHQIDGVTLNLTTLTSAPGINNVGDPGAFTAFSVNNYGFDVVETTAMWNAPGPGDGMAGGTLGPLLSAASFDVELLGQSVSFGDSPAFRSAVSEALGGDGFLRLIIANSDETNLGTHDFTRFESDDTGVVGSRPELTVNHSIPEPSTAALLGLGGLALVSVRRRK